VVVPTFSEEEMNAARAEAFAQGRERGLSEAAASVEQAIAQCLSAVDRKLNDLIQAIADAHAAASEDAVAVATAITRRVFPAMNQANALGEVERTVVDAMRLVFGEPGLVIYVNDTILPGIAARAEALSALAQYRGRVEIKAEPALAASDCRVEWTGGSAVRDTTMLWQAIDEILERNFSGPVAADSDSVAAPTADSGSASTTSP
jgi:flagellar assembly protein FliH